MALRDEVRDPWSYVLGGLAGGLAWAVLAPVAAVALPAGVAVGAAVFGAKVLTGAFTDRGQERQRRRGERLLPVIGRTEEAAWLDRARRAQGAFDDIARSAPHGPVAARVRELGAQTDDSLASLERLAGQASAVRVALGRIDPHRLAAERDRLASTGSADSRVAVERARSAAAVQSQLDAYERLTLAMATILARLESGALGLEGLVARLAEVVALTETSGTASDGLSQVDDLAAELEGLRAGLVEAEGVSTRAIEGLAPLPGSDPTPTTRPAPGSVRNRGRGRAGE
ncbi:MAG: hypothetical protein QOE45_540 [Frankiaceae bacterium]|jgi:hypothetical protein|nr:hypothetical protein [Frankiaceae bacterium]